MDIRVEYIGGPLDGKEDTETVDAWHGPDLLKAFAGSGLLKVTARIDLIPAGASMYRRQSARKIDGTYVYVYEGQTPC